MSVESNKHRKSLDFSDKEWAAVKEWGKVHDLGPSGMLGLVWRNWERHHWHLDAIPRTADEKRKG